MSDAIFLKIDGIPGTSRNPRHAAEMEVIQWEWEAAVEPGPPAAGSGRLSGVRYATPQRVHIVKPTDFTSQQLLVASKGGEHFPRAVLTVYRRLGASEFPVTVVVMTDVRVDAMQVQDQGGKDPGTLDVLTLACKAIDIKHHGGRKAQPKADPEPLTRLGRETRDLLMERSRAILRNRVILPP